MIEAQCTRCGAIFVPQGTQLVDLIHGQNPEGQECGGIGTITGQWVADMDDLLYYNEEQLREFEAHGEQEPNCTEEDCKFHFPPEVQTWPIFDHIVEYICSTCHEAYIPHNGGEPHGNRNDGFFCGGLPERTGRWYAR